MYFSVFPFKNSTQTIVVYQSSKVKYDHKDQEQQKRLLKENLKNGKWKMPQISGLMLKSDNLYFDEI